MLLKKLKQKKGETLTETLGSLLIIVPGMIMLAGGIVSAAKINNEVKHSEVQVMPNYTAIGPVDSTTLTGGGFSIKIDWAKDDGSAYYYRYVDTE
ncbi:MAG: hypothetical protein E7302_00210 [Butyrivibrio sp.]|jgi:hypothetical protein|nr:hypothetical protein [Butyrivibrio sp.]